MFHLFIHYMLAPHFDSAPSTAPTTVETCPIPMDSPTFFPATMFSVSPAEFNTPEEREALTMTSTNVAQLPVNEGAFVTLSFTPNPLMPEGTPFKKIAFASGSNIKSFKLLKKTASSTDREEVQSDSTDGSTLFDGTQDLVFSDNQVATKLRIVPMETTDGSELFNFKPLLNACLKKLTQTTTPTLPTTQSTGTFTAYIAS